MRQLLLRSSQRWRSSASPRTIHVHAISSISIHGNTSTWNTNSMSHPSSLLHSLSPRCLSSSATLSEDKKKNSNNTNSNSKGQKLYERYLFLKKELHNYQESLEQQKSQEMYNAWQQQQETQQQQKSASTSTSNTNSNTNRKLNTKTGVAVVKTLVSQTRLQLKQEQEHAQIQSDYQQQADAALRQAAQSFQYPPACLELAQQYIDQVQLEALEEDDSTNLDQHTQTIQEALTLLTQANSPEGWYQHGYLLWTGVPEQTTSDPQEALRAAAAESSNENINSTNNTADRNPLLPDTNSHATSLVLPRNPERAMQSFYKAIEQHSPDAMYFVGVQLLSPFMEQLNQQDLDNDMRQRVVADGYRLLEQAASIASHGPALYYLALLHLNGNPLLDIPSIMEQEAEQEQMKRTESPSTTTTTIDFTPFTTRLDKAVQAGHADAYYLRGHVQYHGQHGYAVSLERALQDWVEAAKLGHADAAVSAGALYFAMGDPASQSKAFELYQQAGEWGNDEGWRNVISCYLTGKGVPQSIFMAKYIAKTIFHEEISEEVVAAATAENDESSQ